MHSFAESPHGLVVVNKAQPREGKIFLSLLRRPPGGPGYWAHCAIPREGQAREADREWSYSLAEITTESTSMLTMTSLAEILKLFVVEDLRTCNAAR
jgi:hypothetical protein